jgi:hypothetical protein
LIRATDSGCAETYSIEPKLVDGFTHLLSSLELNTELATVFINRVLPFWSNALLENKAVGANIQTSNLHDIAPGTEKFIKTYEYHMHAGKFRENTRLWYLQKSSTVLNEKTSLRFWAQF